MNESELQALDRLKKLGEQRVRNERAGYVMLGLFFPWLIVYLIWIMPLIQKLLSYHHVFHIHIPLIFLGWAAMGFVLSLFFPPVFQTDAEEAHSSSFRDRLEQSAIYKMFF